jgi:hypothetical protein
MALEGAQEMDLAPPVDGVYIHIFLISLEGEGELSIS